MTIIALNFYLFFPDRMSYESFIIGIGFFMMGFLIEKFVKVLSGGEKARLALARMLVSPSHLVLLDEPLANLDVHLRSAMEEEFANFHVRSGATMLYITHDQSEAMSLADKVAVMDQGKIVQFAKPRTLFREPANQMVAKFIGEGRIIEVEDLSPIGGGHAKANLFGTEVT